MRLRHGRNNHAFTFGQHRRARRGLRIACAQVASALRQVLSAKQALRVRLREPSAFFGNANGHYLIFIFVDCLENRGR